MDNGVAVLIRFFHGIAREERPSWLSGESLGDLPNLCLEVPELIILIVEGVPSLS